MKAAVKFEGDRDLSTERTFDAPRERVWRAYTEAKLVAQWWGRGNRLDVEKLEVKRGGHWRFVEHEGGQAHGFEGRFREVQPIELLEQTFEWDGAPGHVVVETIRFEAVGNQTRVRINSRFFDAADRDDMAKSGMEAGMNQSFDALDRLLAAQKSS